MRVFLNNKFKSINFYICIIFVIFIILLLTNINHPVFGEEKGKTLKQINIFPALITLGGEEGEGEIEWKNINNVYSGDLSSEADLSEFSQDNSVYIKKAGEDEANINSSSSPFLFTEPEQQTQENPQKIEETNENILDDSAETGAINSELLIEENILPAENPNLENPPPNLETQPVNLEALPAEGPKEELDKATDGEAVIINYFKEKINRIFSSILNFKTAKANENPIIDISNVIEEQDKNTGKSLIFSDFSMPPGTISSEKINNLQLRLSLAAFGQPGDRLLIEYSQGEIWNDLYTLDLSRLISNKLNGGYFLYALPVLESWDDLGNFKIRITYLDGGNSKGGLELFLDSLWLEVDCEESGVLIENEATQEIDNQPVIEEKEKISLEEKLGIIKNNKYNLELISNSVDFSMIDQPKFDFLLKKNRGLLSGLGAQILGLFRDEYENIEIKAEVFNLNQEKEERISPVVSYQKDGKFKVELDRGLRKLKSGKYSALIEIWDGEEFISSIQDFTWGVLAINLNKSVYAPTETAYLQMGVLDDFGHTICDAGLYLEITAPDGGVAKLNTENGLVIKNQECGPNNVIDSPDYYAHYGLAGAGKYKIKLTANTANGVKEITDEFEVRDYIPFEIERIGPTRIYPLAPYQMKFSIKANKDFKGTFSEYIPGNFTVTESVGAETVSEGNYIFINWPVDWQIGQTYEYQYTFDAPDVSPEFYLLGPARAGDFEELRQWQIASDAVENLWSGSNAGASGVTVTNTANANGSATSTWSNAVDSAGRWAANAGTWTFTMNNSAIGTGTINSVYLYLKHYQSGQVDDALSIQVYDGTAWTTVQSYNATTRPPTGDTTNNWDVSSILNTWTKIDAALIRILGVAKVGGHDAITWYVDTVELRVDYVSNSPPDQASSLLQYRSDGATVIPNNGWSNGNIVLKAQATDADTTEIVSLYFEFIASSTSFTTSTSLPAGACASGTAYGSCSGKIWYITSPFGNYSATPFIGTSSIVSIPVLAEGYKWQVLACDDSNSCSAWTKYNSNTPNIKIDTTNPTAPGNLTEYSKTDSTITLTFGGQGSDANFDKYKIFYKEAISGVTENDMEKVDSNLNFINYNGFSTTTVSGLSSNKDYVLNIWIYDLAGNKASASEINIKTEVGINPPTGSFNSIIQKADGSGTVDVSIEIDDQEDENVRAKIEYVPGGDCDFSSFSYFPTLDETDANITADFGDPAIDNLSAYQIGTSSAWIKTASGSNSVSFDWNSKADLPNGNGVYCLRLTANDNNEDQAISATATTTVDNVKPTQPGSLTSVGNTGYSVILLYGDQSSETNFKEYKIFYKQGSSGVTEADMMHASSTDSNLGYINFNSATTTIISGLSPGTQYVFNIWSYDKYGNKASSTQELTLFTSTVTITDKHYWIIPDSGTNVGADTTSFACNTTLTTIPQTTILSTSDSVCGSRTRVRIIPTTDGSYLHLFAVLNTVYTEDTYITGSTTASAITVFENTGTMVNWYLEFCEYNPSGAPGNCKSLGTSDQVSANGNNVATTLYPSTQNMTGGLISAGNKLAVKIWKIDYSDPNWKRDELYLDENFTPGISYINIKESVVNTTPNNTYSLVQYKSDGVTSIANGSTHNENNAILSALAKDNDNNEVLTIYFELIPNASSFTISNTKPASSCSSGTAYASCSNKIWSIVSVQGNYKTTPFTGTSSIPLIPDSAVGYKWQTLSCDKGGLCSSWVKFNTSVPNFKIDTSPGTAGSLGQYKANGTTAIANKGWTNENQVKLKSSVTDPDSVETLTLFFELIDNASSFTSATTSACAFNDTWSGCSSKIWSISSSSGDYRSTPFTGEVNPNGIPDSADGYKWQVIACDSTNTCSSWVDFNSDPNFKVDFTAPTAPAALSFNNVGATSITFNLGTPGSDTNFDLYRIFYKIGTSGVKETDTPFNDNNFNYVDFNGAATTTISSLSANSDYVFNIWIYDKAGNKASSTPEISTTTKSSFTPPTGLFNSVAQKTDGSGAIDISIQVDDDDNDDILRAKLEYEAGSSCAFSPGPVPYIDETDENITAVHGDPDVDNNSEYQVGTSTGWIITSLGVNYVQFDWLSKMNVPTADGTYCMRLTVNDGGYSQITPSTQLLIIDNIAPIAPGALTLNKSTATTLTLNLGSQSFDTRFNDYRVFYSTTSPATVYGVEHDDQNFDYANYNGATTTVITGLKENTQYYINIWAYDDLGNKASSTSQLSVKTNGLPYSGLASGQYKNDGVTAIANGDWTDENTIKLTASANDPDTSEMVTLYFELLPNTSSFKTATGEPTGACVYGTAYNSCTSKIWFVASSSPGDYSVTPFTDTVSITSIPDSATGYKWQLLACDDSGDCANSWVKFNVTQPNFKVDNTIPTAAGQLTENTKTSRSITLNFGSQGSDANFLTYKIFYATTSPVSEASMEHVDSNLGLINYNGASTTLINNLESNTAYYINIWIYDQAGNKASSTAVSITTSNSGTPVSAQYWITPDYGTNVGADTTSISCNNSLTVIPQTALLVGSDSSCASVTRIRYTPTANGTYLIGFFVLNNAYTADTYISGNSTASAMTVSEFTGTSIYWYYEFCEYDPSGSPRNCNSIGTSTSVSEGALNNNTTLYPVTVNMTGGTIHAGNKLAVKVWMVDSSNPNWNLASFYLDESNTPGVSYINITETLDVVPSNPYNLNQYKSDGSIAISNGGWTGENQVILSATVTDPELSDTITLYFEVLDNSGSFTTDTAEPVSPCSSGTAFADCSSKIWSVTSALGNYSSTPYTGTSSITSLADSATGYKWHVLACDSGSNCSSWSDPGSDPNFKVDIVSPTSPGALTVSSKNSTSVTLNFGTQTTESNFFKYRIFYKIGASGVAESDNEHGDSDLNFIDYNGTFNTTVNNLSPNTQYVFNIWAYDLAGNKASSTTEVATTTNLAAFITQKSYLLENDDGVDVNSNTAEVSPDNQLSNVNIGERINARIQIDNTGGDDLNGKIYKLQFENQTDNPGTWTDVGNTTQISYSLGLSGANADPITSFKATANTNTWTNGLWHENTGQTGSYSLQKNKYTEFVFAIKTNLSSPGKTYRLRLYNQTDSAVLGSYSLYPTIVTAATDIKKYSKDKVTSLGSTKNDLTYYFDPQGYSDISADDSDRDGILSFAQIPVFNFAIKHTNNTDAMSIGWNGQSSFAPSTNNVILQVFRFGTTNSWVTVDTESAAGADTDFDLIGSLNSSLSEYYDGSNWTYWRVYQTAGIQVLKSDYFNINFSAPIPETSQIHYRWRDDDGSESGASWKEAEDAGYPTLGTALNKLTNVRLRISVSNTGGGDATNNNYRLEYAPTATNCLTDPGGWITVPITAATESFNMATSSNFSNGDATTKQLIDSEGYVFTSGNIIEDPSNTTSNITLSEKRYTEVEYVFKANNNAGDGATYCFRVTNNGASIDNYNIFPELTLSGVINTVPAFTINPVDNGSASTTPTNYGSNVNFLATASDPEDDDYYLAICKTDSITAGNDGPPSCAGGSWCVSSLASSTVEANCSYAVATSTEELPWYGFVCDKRAGTGVAKCSASSQGGWGNDDDSPFNVNNRPVFTSVSTLVNNQDPGSLFTITTVSSDTDSSGGTDTLYLYVCRTNGATAAGCTGGAGNTVCSAIATSSPNAKCYYQDTAPTPAGVNTYYAFIFDNHDLAASSNSRSSSYAINNVAPTLGSLFLNGGANISLNIKGAPDTLIQTINTSVVDPNGCGTGLVSATAVIYMSNAVNGNNCTGNDNDCYQIATGSCVKSACTGDDDDTATYTCGASLKHFAIPTDDSDGNPWEPHNWLSTIRIFDGVSYAATTSPGVELVTSQALEVTETVIDFGSTLFPGENSGTNNKTTEIINFGNCPIDTNLLGTDMAGDPSGTINVNNLEWDLTQNFSWSSGNDLTTFGTNVDTIIPKATSSNNVSDIIYWGIGIPFGSDASTYTGLNTFGSVLDNDGW